MANKNSKNNDSRNKTKKDSRPKAVAADPVDVVDGMPDVSANRATWKYIALAVAFAAWLAFLIYCALAG